MSDYAYAPQPPVRAAKDTLIAYLLWFFLGTFGIHKFYLLQKGQGIVYLILGLLAWSTTWMLVGFLIFIPLGILMFIDLFTMPDRIRKVNSGQI